MGKINLSLFFLLLSLSLFGQSENYEFSRECLEVKDEWHSIELPVDLYVDLQVDFDDIRIFGTSGEKSWEAPYVFRQKKDSWKREKVDFEIVNKSFNKKGQYFTFELAQNRTINEIELDFQESNYDWKVRLEGSHNQKEWFTILDDYQIIAINNNRINFNYSKLEFEKSNFAFYRVLVRDAKKTKLNSASIFDIDFTPGNYRVYEGLEFLQKEVENSKMTAINVKLPHLIPVSEIEVDVKDDHDYYRKIQIHYLRDSIKSEKGWFPRFASLTTSSLNSYEKTKFRTRDVLTNELKLLIYNDDNEPLTIESIQVKSPTQKLVARFDELGTYRLHYGNPKAVKPKYDIVRFLDKIPENPIALELGPVVTQESSSYNTKTSFFQSKAWLYGLMLFIIVILGFFTLKMMRDTKPA